MNDSLLVAHVITSLEVGGAQKLVYELVRNAAGWRSAVISLIGGEFAPRLEKLGVPVVVLGENPYSFRAVWRLRKALSEIKPDVIHAHLFPASFWVASLQDGTPRLFTEHSLTTRRRGSLLGRYVDGYQYKRYDQVCAVSHAAAAALSAWIPSLAGKIEVIYNGLSHSVEYPTDQATRQRPLDVLFVGRLVRTKGCDIFLRSLARLKERRIPITARVVGDGPELGHLQTLAVRLGLGEKLFIGQSLEVDSLMRESKILAVPSRSEAFGLVAIEGMSHGAVPIATRVGGLSEVVRPGRNGILIPNDDPEQLADAIEFLLSNPDEWARLSQAAQEDAHRLFSVERMVHSYAHIYRRLVTKGRYHSDS